jgi:hypothetical protein
MAPQIPQREMSLPAVLPRQPGRQGDREIRRTRQSGSAADRVPYRSDSAESAAVANGCVDVLADVTVELMGILAVAAPVDHADREAGLRNPPAEAHLFFLASAVAVREHHRALWGGRSDDYRRDSAGLRWD